MWRDGYRNFEKEERRKGAGDGGGALRISDERGRIIIEDDVPGNFENLTS